MDFMTTSLIAATFLPTVSVLEDCFFSDLGREVDWERRPLPVLVRLAIVRT